MVTQWTPEHGLQEVNVSKLLELLIAKLKTLEPGQFDINDYFEDDGEPRCCVGWATTIPEWNAFGLIRDDVTGEIAFRGDVCATGMSVGHALGLSATEIESIFYGDVDHSQSKEEIIKRLERLAANDM